MNSNPTSFTYFREVNIILASLSDENDLDMMPAMTERELQSYCRETTDSLWYGRPRRRAPGPPPGGRQHVEGRDPGLPKDEAFIRRGLRQVGAAVRDRPAPCAGAREISKAETGGQADRRTGKQAYRQTGGQADRRTSRQADRQTGGKTNRRTGRQADRQTGEQTDRQADDKQATDRPTDR
ncbi:hypothetical protein EVAR_78973_1 [Eumeta japonica]|uniref:Uncharacterized protein n=1 Tax=Eumeta variegata TaxID=151549 RepID=A0A4C1USI3_EUMVA|nr:hypothetical protein EVAR_78973_1 [Eumeta japonica]